MTKDFLDKLCCPIDKADLEVKVFASDMKESIIEGVLTCPKCGRYYPITHGVPIMSPDNYREKTLEAPILSKWGLQADGSSKKMKLLES